METNEESMKQRNDVWHSTAILTAISHKDREPLRDAVTCMTIHTPKITGCWRNKKALYYTASSVYSSVRDFMHYEEVNEMFAAVWYKAEIYL
jgi:hypothetical protein